VSNISLNQLANEIANAVLEYTEEVSEAVEKKVDEVAGQVLAEVKANYPYADQSGDYTKGWRKKKEDKHGLTRRIVWNKTNYQLTHLLEFGHAKRGGGRVRAYPHIGPADQKYVQQLADEIKRIVQNGG